MIRERGSLGEECAEAVCALFVFLVASALFMEMDTSTKGKVELAPLGGIDSLIAFVDMVRGIIEKS